MAGEDGPVRVVRAGELTDGDPTPGMRRQVAFEAPGLWAGVVHTEPGATSGLAPPRRARDEPVRRAGPHAAGVRARRSGERRGGAGRFPPRARGAVHRESNPSPDETSTAVIARAGSGAPTVNVAGPAAEPRPPRPDARAPHPVFGSIGAAVGRDRRERRRPAARRPYGPRRGPVRQTPGHAVDARRPRRRARDADRAAGRTPVRAWSSGPGGCRCARRPAARRRCLHAGRRRGRALRPGRRGAARALPPDGRGPAEHAAGGRRRTRRGARRARRDVRAAGRAPRAPAVLGGGPGPRRSRARPGTGRAARGRASTSTAGPATTSFVLETLTVLLLVFTRLSV